MTPRRRSWLAGSGGRWADLSACLVAAMAAASCTLQAQAVDAPAMPPPQATSPTPSVAPPSALPAAWNDITALVGDAACSTDSQCRTVAVGSKACGGPAAYLAWSINRTDGIRLATAAARHAELMRGQQRASGIASNCAFVADPGAACKAARCELRSAGDAALQ